MTSIPQTIVSSLFPILTGMACVFIFLFIWLIVLSLKTRKINKLSKVFFEGKSAGSLEEKILQNIEDIKSLDQEIQELYDISNRINNLAQRSLHRVGMVRFNPFKDIGGDQSFSLAMLDGKNSGITLSSLHTREGTRIYVKPINKGKSEKYTLTNEEIRAVKIASANKTENSLEAS